MTPDARIFRAYDIRGVVGDTLTPEAVFAIGQAFASECLERSIDKTVVARDGRLSGPDLLEALTRGLQASGVDVIDIGMAPTPVLYYATYELGTGTGIMITGSHNPPDYNGLKMVCGGDALYGDDIQALHKRLVEQRLHQGTGGYSTADVLDLYVDRILDDVELKRPMRIAYDCGNGVAGTVATRLFDGLGLEGEELFVTVDGSFPNHHPDPAKPANLADLIERVRAEELELGLAFDGDGDRMGVVDDRGRIIWPDRQMVLFAEDVLSRNPGARIIHDVKCSRVLPEAIQAAGGVAEMYKTGHSLIKSRMRETGALLGGEMSGHIFFKERWYGFDDALYAAARLLEILSASDERVSERFAAIPDYVNTPEINIGFDEEDAQHRFMKAFVEAADFPGATVNTIDGLRADYPDGWALVRASNTTPSLVIRFEADDQAALDHIQNIFRRAIRQIDGNIDIPF